MSPEQEAFTHVVAANAIDLGAAVLAKIVGNEETSSHIRGEEVYGDHLTDLVAANINASLASRTV